MNDDKKSALKKPLTSPVQVSNAPPPITPLRGTGYPFRTSSRRAAAKLPDWNYWKHMDEVAIWQACALALNIDPESMRPHPQSWMHPGSNIFTEESFTSDEQADSFVKVSRRLNESLSNRQHFTPTSNRDVHLSEFAAWCVSIGMDIPQELAALAKDAPQDNPATTVETPDKALAALFDPVPVEALEKMFPAEGKWKSWAEKAASNGLKIARTERAKFNPYKAGVWFVRKGAKGWDDARLHRTLANNLPTRSRDDKHLLTGGLD